MIADVISDLFEAFFMTVMIPFYPLKKNVTLKREKKKTFRVMVMLLKCFCFRENTLVTLCFLFPSLFFFPVSFVQNWANQGGVTIKINLPLRTSGCACLRLLPVGPHFSPALKKIHLYQSFTLQNQWQPSFISAQSAGELRFSHLYSLCRETISTISPYKRQANQRKAVEGVGNGLKSK